MKKIILASIFMFLLGNVAQAASGPCADFFYGIGCPHCEAVKPFISQLEEEHPTWQINWYEVYQDDKNSDMLTEMFALYGISRGGVPIVFVGDSYIIGDTPIKSGLEAAMQEQRVYSCPTAKLPKDEPRVEPIAEDIPLTDQVGEPVVESTVENQPSNSAVEIKDIFGILEQSDDTPDAASETANQSTDSIWPKGTVAYAIFAILIITMAALVIRGRK